MVGVCKWFPVVCAAALLGAAAAAQAPRPPEPRTVAGQPEKKSATGLEALKLPAGAILVLCEEVKESLQLLPRAVILPPEEYQKLQDQIEQLKRQLKGQKPEPPSACRISGKVEGDRARLRVRYEFRTERPGAVVALGCQKAWPTAATLDGRLPALQATDEGLQLQVETPGAHQATLDLDLPLAPRAAGKGSESGFDLDLPRAAIVLIDQLDLPATAAEVRVGGRVVRARAGESGQRRLQDVPVGAAERLELAWKTPAAAAPAGPAVLAVTAKITARANEAGLFTEADLTLRVLRGETARWQVRLPPTPDATPEVRVPPQDEPRVAGVDPPAAGQEPVWTVRLKEPSADPLHVIVQTRQSWHGKALAVGPFVVPGAVQQAGDVEVRAPDELRLFYQPQGPVVQHEVTEEQRREDVRAAFGYWNLPSVGPGRPVPALLSVQVEPVRGAVEVRTSHAVRLVPGDGDARTQFQVTTRVDATPVRTAVDRIEVALPEGYDYDRQAGATPAELVEDVVIDAQKHTALVRLAQKQLRSFSISLSGSLPGPAAGEREALVELPHALAWGAERPLPQPAGPPAALTPVLERGGQVAVTLPEGLELLTPQPAGTPLAVQRALQSLWFPPRPRAGAREYTWQTERAPTRVKLSWRPHRADLPADVTVDVTFAGRLVRVRERIQLTAATTPAPLRLRLPEALRDRIVLLEGGSFAAGEADDAAERTVVPPPGPTRAATVALEYVLAAGELVGRAGGDSALVRLPLVQPADATRGETRVRVWSEPGERPELVPGNWRQLPTEVVADRATLPDLVARAGFEAELALRLSPSSATVSANGVVERALFQAGVATGGERRFRLRFLLAQLVGRHLDVELPFDLPGSRVSVSLDGRRVTPRVLDERGRDADRGRLLRVAVDPDLYHKPVTLDVAYQVEPNEAPAEQPFRLALEPAHLRDVVFLGRARWKVDLPAGWVLLAVGRDCTPEQQWVWWGRLPAPRPAVSATELERWFTGSTAAGSADDADVDLTGWQSGMGSLALMYAPQLAWLFACSLGFLVVGLTLFFVPLPRVVLGLLAVLAALGVAVAGSFFPGLLGAVAYGCEPGVLVLVCVVVSQWMLHQRYRRRVVFLPGFSRVKQGSSLVRAGKAPAREPSTVDLPGKRGSSFARELKP